MTNPEQPSPWSYESETVGYEPPGQPVLDAYEPVAEPARRRRRTPILIAVAVVVALILGGAAYAGARLWYGSGAQPEDVTPSTVVAFARLDLSPGLGQKLKVNNLLKKFPHDGRTATVDELKEGLFRSLDITPETYRAQIQPWFADRVGVGAWLDGDRPPYVLTVLASRDDAKARAGLAQIQGGRQADRFAFLVRDGHALIVTGERDAQSTLDAAARAAEQETLAESAAFRRGADWLGGEQTAIGWADFDRVRDALGPMAERLLGTGAFLEPGIAGLPAGLAGLSGGDGLKGQLIVGLRATDNGAEIRFRGFGTGVPAQPVDVRSTVDALPGDSAIAGAFHAGDLAGQLPKDMFTPPDVDKFLPEDLRQQLTPEQIEEMLGELRKANERTAAIGRAVASLSGSTVSVAVSGLDDERPMLSASAQVASADKAAALVDAVKQFGEDVTVTASGNRVQLTTEGYRAGAGTLGGQALYREALAGAPDGAALVVYADIQRLLGAGASLSEQDRRELAPLKAIGIAVGVDGGDSVGLVRVVIR